MSAAAAAIAFPPYTAPMPFPTAAPAETPHSPHAAHPIPLREQAFTLHCQGLRSPAIARELAVPERTVRSWITAALDELKDDHAFSRREQLLIAVERQHALTAAAWQQFEAETAARTALLDAALAAALAAIPPAGDAAPDGALGDTPATPPPHAAPVPRLPASTAAPRYLSLILQAHKETNRLLGLYTLARLELLSDAEPAASSASPTPVPDAPAAPTATASPSPASAPASAAASATGPAAMDIPAVSATAAELAAHAPASATGSATSELAAESATVNHQGPATLATAAAKPKSAAESATATDSTEHAATSATGPAALAIPAASATAATAPSPSAHLIPASSATGAAVSHPATPSATTPASRPAMAAHIGSHMPSLV